MQKDYAGFWIRVQAQLIDGMLFALIDLILIYSLFKAQPDLSLFLPKLGIILYLIMLILPVISFLYQILLTVNYGGGLGKLISGIKVFYEDGKLLTFRQALFRQLVGYFVSGMLYGLGYIWIFRDKNRQGWHDQVSGTFVVYYRNSLRFVGTAVLALLLFINAMLVSATIQSVKANTELRDEISTLIEEIGKQLENQETPDTIKPQETPTII